MVTHPALVVTHPALVVTHPELVVTHPGLVRRQTKNHVSVFSLRVSGHASESVLGGKFGVTAESPAKVREESPAKVPEESTSEASNRIKWQNPNVLAPVP